MRKHYFVRIIIRSSNEESVYFYRKEILSDYYLCIRDGKPFVHYGVGAASLQKYTAGFLLVRFPNPLTL